LPGLSSTGIHRNDKLKGLAINVAKLCQHLDICKDGRSDRDGTSRDDKATVFSSIQKSASNRSAGIADDCETPGQQSAHHIHFCLLRMMMPTHGGLTAKQGK
jgi:hypothetical protein